MTPPLPAAHLRPAILLRSGFTLRSALVLLATCAAGCTRDDAPARPPPEQRLAATQPAGPSAGRGAQRPDARTTAPRPDPPRPDRPAAMVFDTVAPPRAAPPEPARTAPAPPPERPPAPRRPRPTPGPGSPGARAPEPAPPGPTRAGPARAGPTGSCDVRPAEGYCFAYTGPAWTPAAAAANCAAAPGAAFRTAPCPTAGRIATCTFRRPSEPDRELVYTTYAPASLDLARLACPGTFEVIE